MTSRSRSLLLLAGALALAGCANQLPQRSEHEARQDRTLKEQLLFIDVGEPATLDQPQRLIRTSEVKRFDVEEYEVVRRYDRYTPYQAWRELYEIPLGALAVVAGTGANLANIVALGNLPDSATQGWFDYGFAGLNPFLNTESNGRSQQNLAAIDEQLIEQREEENALPWAERKIVLRAGEQEHELLTDRNGWIRLNLLDAPFSDQDLSQITALQFSVSSDDGSTQQASLLVSPALRQHLNEARILVLDDLETGDVQQWVARVKRLAELGLNTEADELEQSLLELTRNDPELQQDLLKQLEAETGRTPSVLAAD